MAIITFLVSAIKFGMVLLLGSTGETITEKSGHLNLGLPGVMCVGTACGCVAEAIFFDLVGGRLKMEKYAILAILIPILATLIGGALMGLIFSFLTVTLKANQNVTGLAMTTLGVGISDFMIASVEGYKFTAGAKFFNTTLPFADSLGWFGKLFFSYGIMVYVALAIAIVTAIVLNKTKVGLHLRAVGENPATAEAAGINVDKMRIIGTTLSTVLGAVGILVYSQSYGFMQLYTAPRQMGFVAASAILIGGASTTRCKVSHVLIGTFLFQGVLTLGMPVANVLVPGSTISETLRILISNGIILYALTKSGGESRA